MRVAFFSPLPPARSGIADYSAALLERLKTLAVVDVFEKSCSPSGCDIAVYQMGNNPYHSFVYDAAIKHPGVVVLHEANLHHLIADITIGRKDWDGYVREVERNHGKDAADRAQQYVRTRKRPPEYDLPMLRSILTTARGVIVHSDAVQQVVRANGFQGPVAKIPHGSWTAAADRMAYRARLELDERTPLIGIFGFLKPYKRIAESLRAFRRLVRLRPDARMILVGEAHPDLSMEPGENVRHLGFVPIEDLNGYMNACDIVLNLRYPTVGETSGTLLRALGMGKAVLVSDVGSFCEFPDDICLKVPVDSSEEEYLFEYLNLLVSRPEVGRALGERARAWAERECSWDLVARRYAEFLTAVVEGRESVRPERGCVQEPVSVPAAYIASWTPPEEEPRAYVETHRTRLEKTLELTPRGRPGDSILEMGAYLNITPALKTRLGYGEVRGCYYGPLGNTEHRVATSGQGEAFTCDIDLFDAEKDQFPYPDSHFSTVLCCEILEHLPADPMHMMSEIHRILKTGGALVLTTPNIASLRAAAGILQGFHPMLFPAYVRPGGNGETEARHNREYTPREVRDLLENSGFEVTVLETGPFREQPKPELAWVENVLDRYILPREHRGDGIYAVARKTGPVRDRYPAWLYS